jgi:PKHD-type hydroxylase
VKGFRMGAFFVWQNLAMGFQVLSLLSQAELQQLRLLLADVSFVDGRTTTSGSLVKRKNNLQFGRGDGQDRSHPATVFVHKAMSQHRDLLEYTLAKHWIAPSFSQYDKGMYYGDHIDAGGMPASGGVVRTDFAMTLFLSDPKDYDGGELVLQSAYGEEEIKLEAGKAVIYSANLLHRVEPVTRGSRLVCLSWIQSQIADDRFRDIVQDLNRALVSLQTTNVDPDVLNLIAKSQQNLIRIVSGGV